MGRKNKRWKKLRHELAAAQNFKCCYCKRRFGRKKSGLGATIEHLKPKMCGGTNARDNLAAACLHCNQHRGAQMNTARQRRNNGKAQTLTAVPLAETISIEPVSPITS
ncbi:MAG: HNH endonuclease [Erythrobacter sp.]|nr:HNH endonuclease [Erythrobacter sp.]